MVTNAFLHAGTEIELLCRVTDGCVRVEVRDESPVTPGVRHYDDEATTGRGLGMVEMLAASWGIDATTEGKTIWFEIGTASEDSLSAAEQEPEVGPCYPVRLQGAPVALLRATLQYGDALMREVALLAMADAENGGWRAPRIDLGPVLDPLDAAFAEGKETVDLEVELPVHAAEGALERLAIIDEADRRAQEGELLMGPAVPEIAACRRWLLTEINRQAAAAAPARWELPPPLDPTQDAARLADDVRDEVVAAAHAVVVADDANRIVLANDAAAELLGWPTAADLAGKRLTTLIPPRFREAHLAGFTRYQLSGETRVLGRPLEVPVLRGDGSEVDVELTIEAVPARGGRTAFRAALRRRD
jgi:PAS domain S-box-containing protein